MPGQELEVKRDPSVQGWEKQPEPLGTSGSAGHIWGGAEGPVQISAGSAPSHLPELQCKCAHCHKRAFYSPFPGALGRFGCLFNRNPVPLSLPWKFILHRKFINKWASLSIPFMTSEMKLLNHGLFYFSIWVRKGRGG